jgi:hypothetical protein
MRTTQYTENDPATAYNQVTVPQAARPDNDYFGAAAKQHNRKISATRNQLEKVNTDVSWLNLGTPR